MLAGVLLFAYVQVALAAPFGWAGGANAYYNNTGVRATIETGDPYSPSPGYSSAYVMSCDAYPSDPPIEQYIQVGWTKDIGRLDPDRQFFYEWQNDWTGGWGEKYWGNPAVGSNHEYQVAVEAGATWVFRVDGQWISGRPTNTTFSYPLTQIQFFGETSDYYHNRYPGSNSNPLSFYFGAVFTNTWVSAYYVNEQDTYSASTAGNSSSNFTINDTRP